MYSLRILLVALFAALALATPTPTLKKRSFTHHVRRSNVVKRHPHAGMSEMLRVARKYNLHGLLARQLNVTGAGRQSGTVPALPEPNDAEFLSPVQIGGQTLQLDFDTGSSDLWVFSSALSRQTIGQHAVFDPAKSRNFQAMQGATFSISYGDGSGAAGTVGVDVVEIGGVTATRQAVEVATAVSQSFVQDVNNDGLVGLAFSQLNTVKPQKQATFFDTVMRDLAMPVFSVDLRNDTTGTYEFGNIDQTKFQGQLTTVPVNAQSGFWQFESPTITVGNQRIRNTGASPAIADTGTSLILVDQAVANAYYRQVPGAVLDQQVGGFTYPCNAQLPDFGVAIGPQYTAIVPGDGITFAQVDQQTCFGGVQGNEGASMQIFGDTMFKTQYVVFDGANKALMIAPKR